MPLFEPGLVSWFDQLMWSYYHFQPVVLDKFRSGAVAEKPAYTSAAQHPTLDLVGVGPHDVPETTNCWNLAYSVDIGDVLKCVDIGGEPSMEA